jgi:uncharacterized protein YjbI with pentapeptide repeats
MPALKAKKSGLLNLDTIPKLIGVVSVLYSAVTYLYQQNKTIEETQNKNFREIVANLASENKAERLSSAINLGTFVKRGSFLNKNSSPYQDEAIDALVNMVLIELDTDILQVISSNLKKLEPDKYKDIVGKLLTIDRSGFIYQDAIKYRFLDIQNLNGTWNINNQDGKNLKSYDKRLGDIDTISYDSPEVQKAENISRPDSSAHQNSTGLVNELLSQTISTKYKESLSREKDFENMISKNKYRSELISDFTIDFLSISRKQQIEGLELYQNSWNYAVISDLKLPKISIKLSAITSALIQGNDFNHAEIKNTTFANSVIRDTNFSESDIQASLFANVTSFKGTDFTKAKFNDVFFALADVGGANFQGAEGLKPVHFYKAKNLDKALFDEQLKSQLVQFQKDPQNGEKFEQEVQNSNLTAQRIDELFKVVGKVDSSDKVDILPTSKGIGKSQSLMGDVKPKF